MAKIYIDDRELELGEHERLNGIQAAEQLGIKIPHYCWHPGLSVVASCRMCLVETGRRDPASGDVSMVPKLVPACQTPATDGTVFLTDSEKVRSARAMVEEDLLIRHPIDCPICDKAGECHLQDYHFEHGQPERRADLQPFTSRRRSMGDTVTLFVDRCVMCSRCVRFTREVTGTAELMVVNRGAHEEIDVFPGYPLDNKMSGNVVDLCPVGALGDKDFLYSQRVWFMKRHAGVCSGCSTGCSIQIEQNQDRLYRLKPRENPHVNEWWMCDEGRYGFKYVHDPRRRTRVQMRSNDGELAPLEWDAVYAKLDRSLNRSKHIAAIVSPFLTVEAAYLLCQFVRQCDENASLVVGHIPSIGKDETFPSGFTIRAEKCPNRRGIEALVEYFGGPSLSMEQLLEMKEHSGRNHDAIWVTGGYPSSWLDSEVSTAIRQVPYVVVQDIFPSPLWDLADAQLPNAAFAEQSGSYVNATNRLQSFTWAIRPPAGVMADGQVYWRLLGREGLYDPTAVLLELAERCEFFAPAAAGVGDHGVDLLAWKASGEGVAS